MAEDFSRSVEEGIRLSKRIYFGNDRAVSPPKPQTAMLKTNTAFLPTSPMMYAVIRDPSIVDNPDVPSYQPHVHGKCDPPALIPLHMMSVVELRADCYLDTAFVDVAATWRLHCVSGSRTCDCVIAIPMGPQGSILGVEIGVHRKSFSTQLVDMEDKTDKEKMIIAEDGGFLKPNMFTMTLPQIDGGSNLSVKIRWSQKITFQNDLFSLNVPFNFPDYVNPAGKRMAKKEKIHVNVNAVTGSEILCKTISHPLKEGKRNAGSINFSYEADVLAWTQVDFKFSYSASSSQINGGVLLESALVDDAEQIDMFCIHLSAGNIQNKVFRKDIVFVVDISGSMRGKLIDDTKNALMAALSKLDPDDSFGIIAFSGDMYLFSNSMELASKDAIERATEWINMNFVAGGDTNLLDPLTKAIEMLSDAQSSLPIIFLVTDGSVEDEREICDMVKNHMIGGKSFSPRIYTLGIGSFCNQYFLRMLAMITRGHHVAALDVDLVEPQILKLFDKASVVLANITMDIFKDMDEVEVFPSDIPDLSSDGPLILSGRYKGSFPEFLEVKGVLGDFSSFVINLKIQNAKDIPVQKIFAGDQMECLTAQAWLSKDKELEQKVAKLSLQTGYVSEYTHMAILEDDHLKRAKEGSKKTGKGANACQRMILLPMLGIGFGNLTATIENIVPGAEDIRLPDSAEMFVKAATDCCGSCCNYCCCMCCIHVCTRLNNQLITAIAQVFVGLGCYSCFNCCSEICCSGNDG